MRDRGRNLPRGTPTSSLPTRLVAVLRKSGQPSSPTAQTTAGKLPWQCQTQQRIIQLD